MGLLYPFPVSEEEKDHVVKTSNSLTLKSYGLPYIFWLYLICILSAIFFLFLAIKAPLMQVYSGEDQINKYIATALLALLTLIPLTLIGFFFFEKVLIKSKSEFKILYRFFGLTLKKSTYAINSDAKFEILHHLDSPNVATLKDEETLIRFRNRGYHELYLCLGNKKFYVDRHSQLNDLKRLKMFLESN